MSGKTAARRVVTGNRTGDEAQRNGRDAVARLNAAIFDGAVLLDAEDSRPPGSGLVFTSGIARSIAHGLGRKAVGFIETYGADISTAGPVVLYATAHPAGITSETHVTVTPSGSGTCFLVVY